MNYIRQRKAKQAEKLEQNIYTRWEQDFDLGAIPDLGLFDEYLEMGKFSHCHFHNFLVHLDLPRSLQYK
jgi:hypothetical protein